MKTCTALSLLLLAPVTGHCAAETLSTSSALLRMAWGLFVVLGIILVLYALVKKKFGLQSLKSGKIKIIEIRHIMPKTALALVQVKEKEILIGIGSGQINLIADLSDEKNKTKTFETILAEEQ